MCVCFYDVTIKHKKHQLYVRFVVIVCVRETSSNLYGVILNGTVKWLHLHVKARNVCVIVRLLIFCVCLTRGFSC